MRVIPVTAQMHPVFRREFFLSGIQQQIKVQSAFVFQSLTLIYIIQFETRALVQPHIHLCIYVIV